MKHEQQGNALAIALLATTLTLGVTLGMSYFSYANKAAKIENLMISKQEQNKSILAGYSTKIKEIAQAAKLGTDAQTKLIEMANKARYGDGGAKASVLFITEQNPNIDASLYTKLQQVIEAERTRFTNDQNEMIAIKGQYKTMIDMPYSGFWLNLAGYPKVNLKDFDVVINSYTDEAYQTKKAESIDLGN